MDNIQGQAAEGGSPDWIGVSVWKQWWAVRGGQCVETVWCTSRGNSGPVVGSVETVWYTTRGNSGAVVGSTWWWQTTRAATTSCRQLAPSPHLSSAGIHGQAPSGTSPTNQPTDQLVN